MGQFADTLDKTKWSVNKKTVGKYLCEWEIKK